MLILIWVALFAILVGVELATFQLVSIWFAAGAIAAFLAALFGGAIELQLILFLAVSLLCLLLVRPLARRSMKKGQVRTNAESLIGDTAVIISEISEESSFGRVMIRGQEWTAAAENPGEHFSPGDKVTVSAISGVKLMVKRRVSS